MKHLKMSMYLLLTAVFFTSCEKETTTISDNPAMNVQEIKTVNPQGPMSMLDLINSGINLETYFKSLPKQENTAARPSYSKTQNPDLQFYYSPEDAACANLPTEDFEVSSDYYWSCLPNNLDENTDTYVVYPGDILPGISFEVVRNDYDFISNTWWGDYYTDADLTFFMNDCGFYIDNDTYYGRHKILQLNYEFTDLVINFSGNNVNNVSMDLYQWSYGNEIIEIYGASDNLIGTDIVFVNYYGTFWGVQTLEPISKIIIKSESYNGVEGIDNVSFGNCNDLDGDSVLNENDPYPNSNMSETLSIGENNLNIDNVFAKPGTTMMDQVDALIAEMNAQYNGENYDYLHKRFMTKLSQLTYYWRTARLITSSQRSQISSAAWSANVPFQNEP